MPLVTYGQSAGEDLGTAELLFRHVRRYAGDDRHAYVMAELEAMIDAGTLYLTDIFRQPSAVHDAVGLALRGLVRDPETLTERPAEIVNEDQRHKVLTHRVRLRCISGRADTIRFKAAVVRAPAAPLGGTRALGHSEGGDPVFSPKVRPMVDKWVDYQKPEADLPLPEAWVALGRHGAHCRYADSQRLQSRYWLFEEVRPQPVKKVRA